MNNGYTIKDIRDGLAKGHFTAEEIFKKYSDKIKKENKKLNAYLSVFENYKLETENSTAMPLWGVPCAIKDNVLIEGTITTAGSKILKNYISAYDAAVIKKLRQTGATFLGKTNMDEFAMGSSTENSAYGVTKNPHDITRVPGGSSGGSAAAVAADLAVFALGSDTGGSIRQPASLCGVVGLKPTYGRVSRHGLVALASSLDQIGPITKNVYDSALVLGAISGHDIFDSTTVPGIVPDYTKNLTKDIKGLRVGVPKEFFGEGLEDEVNQKVRESISKLKDMGCEIVDISLPHSKYALAAYYIIVPCEASANLARFDGIRYGHSSKEAKTLLDTYTESRSEGFGAEPKRRIMLGTYALSSGYYDAYYLKAQKIRALIKKDFDNAFNLSTGGVDVIVGPTSPGTAFKIGEKASDPLSLYLSDIYTVPVNLAGIPALSLPCGKGRKSNLPVGFQIIGRPFDEETVLRVSYQLEQALK
ncbi:MAG: aspartyl/glutamyl-tRNA amidotransferase subunit A [Candidatus Yanofskybacteria bacterium RIFCSPLOWO2_02_FULL_43_10]|uniref:Glutamyl-tRNA(Gln) amidotransferase subunit A n=1 Tax=Candidatus Yanofskybacteria bacterium RIFCSPLOWO2_12_FULL_43_11b TaxID=1802710 RepID=A0A1F8H8X4_9BACT|nr:MAG: aspartyl/glutamyl-tRNA amidotransferase subunit A [Candidatus Yanofskybacteria bacterium RIFCSPHIGHO2_01_FULL_43_32]OGN17167.1 MAG: aspartyl/glutamyl-tRNA amidotransferase subunit A [Candidatus Yanofskybacteria bacterium RIFCSPHIGHO2_12_FULL_43_11]OGN25008.1 MAG: aspartyl/glutamyl-tRNA amidotransferase subunit A [Candidatus Yanofskybacteria bacterium RIFCSPLOWO2_01_FULL_43_46]OGN30166.1 MAG: aspartyl/glutamyl-tRNA amidotransferase subunit A [Candidatus Yanofskybacteria bacterium RIFCSPLO